MEKLLLHGPASIVLLLLLSPFLSSVKIGLQASKDEAVGLGLRFLYARQEREVTIYTSRSKKMDCVESPIIIDNDLMIKLLEKSIIITLLIIEIHHA